MKNIGVVILAVIVMLGTTHWAIGQLTYGREKLKTATRTQGDANLANRFTVAIDGVNVIAINSVTGLASESDVQTYREGGDAGITRTRPGAVKPNQVTIVRDYSGATDFYNWRKTVLDGKVERKSVSIIFHNDAGQEDGRINLFNCWPTKWSGPVLDAKATGHATESLTLVWEGLEIKR